MNEPTITLTQCIEYLNSLIECDERAIFSLVMNRVPCNEKLTEHNTCQVTNKSFVGMLGVINGIFGIKNYQGLIQAVFDDGKLVEFVKNPILDWEN